MTLTCDDGNADILYDLEMIIPFVRDYQYIFVAQCIEWLASIIALEAEIIIYIDDLQQRGKV
jgi:hypothetical protein